MSRKRTKRSWIYFLSCGYNASIFLFWVSSSGRFEYSVGHVEAISVRPEQQNQHHIAGIGGTTSVHYFSETSSLLVGTKKGGIYYSLIEQEQNQDANNGDFDPVTGNKRDNRPDDADENDTDRWIELKSNEYTTKYPIYSTAVMSGKIINSPPPENGNDDKKFIFCGSGDRWISVWKLGNTNNDNRIPNFRNQAPEVEYVQKLGPHTGWVKDLVYDDRNRLLHSIGCNCIETWDCSSVDEGHNDHASNPISHITKRTIENCPTTGSTLSSDLLCLCLLPSLATNENELPRLLVSGGVDGRIHLWLSDPTAERTYGITTTITTDLDGRIPLHTTLAHDGRVNAIVYSSATNAIVTVGNDGLLCVFRASLDRGFELVSRLKIEEGSNEITSRITVASITRDFDEQGRCSLVLGSSKGELWFVRAEINAQGGIDSHVERDCMIVAENSMIYSIASEKDSGPKGSPRLWIGHASGLAMVDAYT